MKQKSMISQEFVSIREAALKLGVSRDTIRSLIGKGVLPAFRFGGPKGDYHLNIKDLMEFIERSRVIDLSGEKTR